MTDRNLVHRRAILRAGASLAASAAFAGGAFAQAAGKQIKVAAIYTVPVEQQWVSRIHKALNAAKDRGEITYKFSESVANNDYERVMRQYSEEGSDLVLGEIFGVERQARRVAAAYPKVAFLMGSSFGPTKSNLIGMVGGYAIPEVNRLMQAFMDGARSVNPSVKFLVTFINSWYDPPKAKEAAFAMIDKGADILYAERFGVSDAAKEKGVKVIGNVIDTSSQYPDTVLASALWHMEPTVDRAIKAVKEGRFEAVDYGQYSQMQYGGATLAVDEKLVPADVVKLVREKEKEITDGLFRVNVNDAEPKAG
jgi:basic membrane lipoprotein Med (substrate-binding protein (PBP1-ABC) superfamily)